MSCMNCDDDDVVVIILYIGRIKSLVELVQLVCENDVMVIVFIFVGMLLVREVMFVIIFDVLEDIDIYMLMVFCLVQLIVIDVLVIGFILCWGVKFRDNLKRVKEVLKELCFDKELFVFSDN